MLSLILARQRDLNFFLNEVLHSLTFVHALAAHLPHVLAAASDSHSINIARNRIDYFARHLPADVWRVWRIGRVDDFRPKGQGFDSRSNIHAEALGKSSICSSLWRFGVKFRHNIRAVSGAPLSSSGLEDEL